jgi:cyanate permease
VTSWLQNGFHFDLAMLALVAFVALVLWLLNRT